MQGSIYITCRSLRHRLLLKQRSVSEPAIVNTGFAPVGDVLTVPCRAVFFEVPENTLSDQAIAGEETKVYLMDISIFRQYQWVSFARVGHLRHEIIQPPPRVDCPDGKIHSALVERVTRVSPGLVMCAMVATQCNLDTSSVEVLL